MDAVTLSNDFSIDELVEKQLAITEDPANRLDGFNLYTRSARKNLSDIAWAITYRMQREKETK